jgi:hypothetical protein
MPIGRRAAAGVLTLCACAGRPPASGTMVHLEIAGGPKPGRYDSRPTTAECLRDLVGPGSWAVQLTDWTGPKSGLRSLQLVVPVPDRPHDFYLGLVFGDLFAGTVHEIETRPNAPRLRGNGAVSLQDHDSTGTMTVVGMTRDSVAISATIACRRGQEHRNGRGIRCPRLRRAPGVTRAPR